MARKQTTGTSAPRGGNLFNRAKGVSGGRGECFRLPIGFLDASRGCIQRETFGVGPYAGADYNLALSHSRIQSPASNPTMGKCRRMFPQLFKNGATKRKRVGANFMS
jgi:hypothetical protein